MKHFSFAATLAVALAIAGTAFAGDHTPSETYVTGSDPTTSMFDRSATAEADDPLHAATLSDAEEGVTDVNSTWSDAEHEARIDALSIAEALPPNQHAVLEEHTPFAVTDSPPTDIAATSSSHHAQVAHNQAHAANPQEQEEVADADVAWQSFNSNDAGSTWPDMNGGDDDVGWSSETTVASALDDDPWTTC